MRLLPVHASLANLIHHNARVSFFFFFNWICSMDLFLCMHCRFFGFNWYRLSIGIDYDWGCTGSITKSQTLEVPNENINETLVDNYYVSAEHEALNRTVFLIAYPCEWGFHYLVSGAAVWLAFLPFYITQLLGNCWRQCCCCLCDPLVR